VVPKLAPAVAAVGDEGRELAVGGGREVDAERRQFQPVVRLGFYPMVSFAA
jgi:hypothetical protein